MAILQFYLGEGGRKAVLEGQNRITTRVASAVKAAGWEVRLCPSEERPLIPGRAGYHLVSNEEVPSANCMTLRRVGWDPFWRIERTNDRWNWQIAGQDFGPSGADTSRSAQFLGYWGKQLFGKAAATSGGGVFVPLQGKLTQQRHFQAASPLQMLEAVAKRWPDRAIQVTLHPREDYSATELASLDQMIADLPNVSLARVGSDALLLACDLVVTQNSTMALRGYVAQKPAMIWARIDFHHIAASVPRDGIEAAFAAVEAGPLPDFGSYLLWYFRENCLRSWDKDVEAAIRDRLRTLDWPL
jgi:hypothetical protein